MRERLEEQGRLWAAFFFAALLICVVPLPAAAAADPTSVRAMLSAGARELALAQIEQFQPRDPAAPRWAEWEGLRCETLARLNHRNALLERVAVLPPEAPAAPLNICFVEASRASVARGDPRSARAHAARLLWQAAPSPAEAKDARLAVIESYVAERRGEDAFHSMLRFQQDYQPLERTVTERFADALIELGHDADALNWIRMEELTPARLRLQLRSGLLAPDAVITQARAALMRDPKSGYWQALHEAAVRTGDASLQIEALERLLQSIDEGNDAAQSQAAQRLWQTYLQTAAQIGNREQLLMGDDAAWADYAAQRLAPNTFLSRSFYAYLAQGAQSPEIRRNAQLQLAQSLYSAGLDNAALRAMQRIGFGIDALDGEARYLLGTIAVKHRDSELAFKLWNGLPTPPNLNAIEWELTLARIALQAGDAAASVATMKRLLEGRTSVSPQLAQRGLEVGQEMLDMRRTHEARTVYDLLVPLSTDAHARQALFGLGRAYELEGEPLAASAHYLRSALLVQATAPDELAFQARLLAALNLMRAGLRDDARAQFEWLLKNAKEPAMIEAAKRGLGRL